MSILYISLEKYSSSQDCGEENETNDHTDEDDKHLEEE